MNQEYKYLEELIERYPKLTEQKNNISKAYEAIKNSYSMGGKLLVAGNGGSAADSEHIVGELMKGFVKSRKLSEEMLQKLETADPEKGRYIGERLQGALPAIALTGHVSLSTAYLNDVDPLLGFAQQLYGYGTEKDVFLAITTSGNSENILYACSVAKAKGMKIVALTGKDGGKISEIADVSIIVNEQETFKIQELHLPIYHVLCLMLELYFFELACQY